VFYYIQYSSAPFSVVICQKALPFVSKADKEATVEAAAGLTLIQNKAIQKHTVNG